MSNAPFDAGHELRWRPLGFSYVQGPVNGGDEFIVQYDMSAYAAVRIDYASVVLDYDSGDNNASAQLLLQNLAFGLSVPFLSVAGDPNVVVVGGVPTVSPYGKSSLCAQLSQPFYLTQTANVYLNGYGQSGNASIARGLVAASAAFTLGV